MSRCDRGRLADESLAEAVQGVEPLLRGGALGADPRFGLGEERAHLGEDVLGPSTLFVEELDPAESLEHAAGLVHPPTVASYCARDRACSVTILRRRRPQRADAWTAKAAAGRGRRPRSDSSSAATSAPRFP